MSILYSPDVLRLATRIPFTDRLDDAHCSVVKTSRICGSRITMDACFEGQVLTRLGLDVKACALGQASAALVAPKLIGRTRPQIAEAAEQFRAMLVCDQSETPDYPFDDLAIFKPARSYKSRHGSLMLIFEVALAAFDMRSMPPIKDAETSDTT